MGMMTPFAIVGKGYDRSGNVMEGCSGYGKFSEHMVCLDFLVSRLLIRNVLDLKIISALEVK